MEVQLNADIQPRFFEERFPHTVLYVRDIKEGTSVWSQIFLADTRPSADRGDIPSITLASEAIAQPDLPRNRIQLTLKNQSTYDANKDVEKYQIQSTPQGDQSLEAQRPPELRPAKTSVEMDSANLYKVAYKEPSGDKESLLETRIELQQRLHHAVCVPRTGADRHPSGPELASAREVSGSCPHCSARVRVLHQSDWCSEHGSATKASRRSRDVAAHSRLRRSRHLSPSPFGSGPAAATISMSSPACSASPSSVPMDAGCCRDCSGVCSPCFHK